jgi:outer membrane protein assembly factor BamA
LHIYKHFTNKKFFAICLVLCFLSQTGNCRAQKEPYESQGQRFTLLPLAGFSSDDGIGYGFRGNVYRYDGQTIPYKQAYALQLFVTSKGKWTHRIKLDLPKVHANDRLEVDFRYDKEAQAAYYGTLSDTEIAQYSQDEQTYETHYKTLGIIWYHTLQKPYQLRIGFIGGHNRITPNTSQNALLTTLAPVGQNGGSLIQTHTALRRDTRDNYLNSIHGSLQEVLVEYGWGPGGTYNGGELSFEHLHFISISQGWTLSQRLITSLTLGDVPFYEQPKLGSSKTVRGLSPARERGEGQTLINTELRWRQLALSQRYNVNCGLVLFTDIGQIYKRTDGPSLNDWQLGFGGGLRIFWYSTIMRLDYGKTKNHQSLYMRFAQTF